MSPRPADRPLGPPPTGPHERGDVFILSAPSGSGKTTLAYRMVEVLDRLHFSRSCTTRPPRPGEVNGVDYLFVDDPTFERMVAGNEFLEWAPVLAHRYGTPKSYVEEVVSRGEDVILNIDVQGARLVKAIRPEVVMIFLLPPSFEELKRRLVNRGGGTNGNLEKRLRTGLSEVWEYPAFDYIVVNDDIRQAEERLMGIIQAHRCRRERREPTIQAILDTFRKAREGGFTVP